MYPGYSGGTFGGYAQQPQFAFQQQQFGAQPQQIGAMPVDLKDETQWRSLYVGNLSVNMPDMLLYEIFTSIAPIANWKIIKDKVTGKSLGYGFVDYYEHEAAKMALDSLNGRKIMENEIKVNWAHIANGSREDVSTHFTLFVGDLSGDVSDKVLQKAFSAYGEVTDSRVMMDPNTGRSRGYGFISFRTKFEAENAMGQMNGEWLGSRAIRVNWANTKNQPQSSNAAAPVSSVALDYSDPSADNNTAVYVGNLSPNTTEDQLRQLFLEFAPHIDQIRLHKGYAFVQFKTHPIAKQALSTVNGRTLLDRNVKCGWGKEKSGSTTPTITTPTLATYAASPYLSQYQYPYQGLDAYSQMAYYPQFYGTQYYGYAPSTFPAAAPAFPSSPPDPGSSILGPPPASSALPKPN